MIEAQWNENERKSQFVTRAGQHPHFRNSAPGVFTPYYLVAATALAVKPLPPFHAFRRDP